MRNPLATNVGLVLEGVGEQAAGEVEFMPTSALTTLCRALGYADVEADSLAGLGFQAGEVGIIR
jgi:hypothetical protein